MSDSTSILDLPTDPVGGGNMNGGVNGDVNRGISLSASENIVQKQLQQPQLQNQSQNQIQPQNPNFSLDQTTISQIVNGLQQAAISGATQLPSRDIPMNTSGHSNDAQVQPNYVPMTERQADYIKDYEDTTDMIDNYNKNVNRNNSLDDMYNEIQTPLLLSVLYFLFQLPFFKRFLFGYFPVLFSNDGNFNINGFLFTSVLFGLLFYLLNKVTSHFGAF
jgi:hypothetical protein